MKIRLIRQHLGNGMGPFWFLRMTIAGVKFEQRGCFKTRDAAVKAWEKILKANENLRVC